MKEKTGLLDHIGKGIDRIVGLVSPEKELKRLGIRAATRRVRGRTYAAAQATRLTGTWTPANQNINTVLSGSITNIRARIRQLIRDFPYFARAIDAMVAFTVGDGIKPQAKIKENGKYQRELNQRIEDEWAFWADEADVSGKMHLYEMMELAKRQDIENGEFLIVKVYRNENGRRYPFALQMIESDWLTDNNMQLVPKTHELKMGVEYDKRSGKAVAYHLTDPDTWGKTQRVMAQYIMHNFKMLRPGQLRGVSPFVTAVLLAHDLNDFMDAEMDAAKLAAKYLAFVESPDPNLFQQMRSTWDANNQKQIEEMENAIIEYLRTGEKITIAEHNRPGSSFSPFVELVLHMLAVATGIPYELLSMNYDGISYSNLKGIRNDFNQILRPITTRHVRHFCMPLYREWLDYAVMTGRIPIKDYFNNQMKYWKVYWQLPGMESIDPLRETKAHVEQIKYNLRSPQEIIAARGGNLEDVLDELQEAKEMAEERGLTIEEVSTALANNPASLGASEERTDEESKERKILPISK